MNVTRITSCNEIHIRNYHNRDLFSLSTILHHAPQGQTDRMAEPKWSLLLNTKASRRREEKDSNRENEHRIDPSDGIKQAKAKTKLLRV